MAHINALNSSTFTTLSYAAVPATGRPANADGWNNTDQTISMSFTALATNGAFTAGMVGGNAASGTNFVIIPRGTRLRNAAGTITVVFQADFTLNGATGTVPTASFRVIGTAGSAAAVFTGRSSVTISSIREFPSMGTPANIVNVPVYGQSISAQVGGQADAPSLEFTLNYVPTDHAIVDQLRRAGTALIWRVTLATSSDGSRRGATDLYDDFYFIGSIASLEVTPALNDAMQASISITINGDFEGPFSDEDGTYGLPA